MASANTLDRRRRALKEIIKRDGLGCFWCGIETSLRARAYLGSRSCPDPELRLIATTFDHVVPPPRPRLGAPPHSRVPYDRASNGVVACSKCNGERGDTEASVFLFEIIRREPAGSCKPSVDVIPHVRAAVAHTIGGIDHEASCLGDVWAE